MKLYDVVLTRRAKGDMIDIGDYIAYNLFEPVTADSFLKGLRRKMESLREFPSRWPLIQDRRLAGQGIRYMPYKNYHVFYVIKETEYRVIILRIGYKRKNWKEILRF